MTAAGVPNHFSVHRYGTDELKHIPAMDGLPLPLCQVGVQLTTNSGLGKLFKITTKKADLERETCGRCLRSAKRHAKYVEVYSTA
jgi:hypothetical protein